MRILVDEMPRTPEDCPYCIDESTMGYSKTSCSWSTRIHGHRTPCSCFYDGIWECPYFTQKDDEPVYAEDYESRSEWLESYTV